MSDTPARPASVVTSRLTLSVTCPRCGAALSASLTVCAKCGVALTEGASDGAAYTGDQTERLRAKLQESIGDAFELLELLGRGGMGIVFRAKERALDREVALKVLALDPVFAPEAYARFEREAKLAAKLDHPNIVPIFAVGHHDSVAYYTMRLVRGGALESVLGGKKPLELEYCIRVLRDVAAALDHAHRQGVVHRDIKPANILLGESGHAMVADFGIAKALGNTTGNATKTGIIGSPAYMSPEQWRGEQLDGRADQYALAVVAFEMLTGARPFETARVEDLLTLHLSAELPDITAMRPALPASTDAALRRGMAKLSSERFSSVSGFVEALAGRRPAAPSVNTARGPRYEAKRTRRGFPWKTAVAVAALAAGVYFVPPAREKVVAFWGGLRHATELFRAQAERLGTAGDASAAVAARDAAVTVDTITPVYSPTVTESLLVAPPELERAPLVLEDSLQPRTPVGPAPFRISGARHGWIRVTVNGGTAPIIINGRSYGSAPRTLRVETGAHIVTVRGAGDMFMPFQHDVQVTEGDTVLAMFEVPVRRPPPQPAPVDAVRPPDTLAAPPAPADSAAPAQPLLR
ncbi:MAG: protein kinase domain-containing protein [Gemmatimonadaceae bacterium]